jgi:hypothetical protein
MLSLRILSLIFTLPTNSLPSKVQYDLAFPARFLANQKTPQSNKSDKKIIPEKCSTTTTKPQLNKNLNPKTKLKTNPKKLQHNYIPQQQKQKKEKNSKPLTSERSASPSQQPTEPT